MVQIFLGHTPRLVRRYTPAQAFQFLMAQSWYTLWSLSVAVLWVLPMVALLSGHRIADVPLTQYLAYNVAMVLCSSLMWWWSRRWFQPTGIGLTWRGARPGDGPLADRAVGRDQRRCCASSGPT